MEKANVIDVAVKQKSGDLNSSPCYVPNVLFYREAVDSPVCNGFHIYRMRGLV